MMLLYVYSMLNDQTSTSNSGKLSEYIKALLEEGVLLSGINLAYYSLTSISMEKVPWHNDDSGIQQMFRALVFCRMKEDVKKSESWNYWWWVIQTFICSYMKPF